MKNKEVKHGFAWLMTLVMVIFIVVASPRLSMRTEAASKKVVAKNVTAVDSLTGSKKVYLAIGKKATLKTTVTVTPNKSSNKQVKYTSSNESVATVTSKGVITGKKVGTAKITVTSKKNSKKKAIVTVKVVKGKVTSVKLNQTSSTLTVGDTIKLTATVKVSSDGKKNVVWTSSDKNIATVKNGKVTAVASGTATITVKAVDGTGKKATCKVTVKDRVTEATTENAAEATTEKSTESATTEKAAEVTTEKSTESATTEKAAEVTTEKSAESATTEKAAEATTEKSTESATTEKAAEVTTEKSAENSTEEPDREEPTQPVEKLVKAGSGVFTNNKVNDCYNILGVVITDNTYKYIVKAGDTYKSAEAIDTDLDKVLESTKTWKKGDEFFISSTEDIDKSKLLVYTSSDELKYEIDFSDLYKYFTNTDTNHSVSVSLKAPYKSSEEYGKEYVVGNTFTFSGKDIQTVYITSGKRKAEDDLGVDEVVYDYDSYFSYSNNNPEASSFDVDFTGENGEYDYEVIMTDGFSVVGKLSQTGVVPASERTQNNDKVLEEFGTVPDPQNPTVTLSEIPTEKCKSFELTISSDIDAQIWFNGRVSEEYLKSAKFTVDSNGVFYYTVSTADGGYTEGSVKVSCIKEDEEEYEKWSPPNWCGQA